MPTDKTRKCLAVYWIPLSLRLANHTERTPHEELSFFACVGAEKYLTVPLLFWSEKAVPGTVF
jgi:hypothetical protein